LTEETNKTPEEKLEELQQKKQELEEELDEKTTCPYCGRDMEIGRIGNGKAKYGCYPPHGNRDDYDCEYYQEHGSSVKLSYTVDLSALHQKINSVEDQIETVEELTE
jgi:hypothetical protein